jgi:DNA-binding CsgD family transcriptional regulator
MQHLQSSTILASSDPAKGGSRDPSSATLDLGQVWRNLVLGHWYAEAALYSSSACFLSVRVRTPPPPLSGSCFEMLERILLGESQKAVAADLGVAISTVASRAGAALRYISFEHRTSRTPFVLAMAAHCFERRVSIPARLIRGETKDAFVVCVPRPDTALARILPPAEHAIACMLMEGKSHAESASARTRSMRTIANQRSAIFARLKVSGRVEFVARLISAFLSSAEQEAAAARLQMEERSEVAAVAKRSRAS